MSNYYCLDNGRRVFHSITVIFITNPSDPNPHFPRQKTSGKTQFNRPYYSLNHLGGLANATEIIVFACEVPVNQQKIILLIYSTRLRMPLRKFEGFSRASKRSLAFRITRFHTFDSNLIPGIFQLEGKNYRQMYEKMKRLLNKNWQA